MGAVDQKDRKATASDVSHRKSNSMDNSIVCAAAVGVYSFSPLRHDSLDERMNSPIRDSHSASCLPEVTTNETTEVDDAAAAATTATAAATNDVEDDTTVLGRLRANSMDLIKRLSPTIKRKSWEDVTRNISASSSRNRSPEPLQIEGCDSAVPLSEEDANRRRTIDRKRSISPFRKTRVPSPIFFLGGKTKITPESDSPAPTPFAVTPCSIPSIEVRDDKSSNLNVKEDGKPKEKSPSPSVLSRRLERRYHTADGIEDMKPKKYPQPGILKRFSWSTPAQHLKAKQMLELSWRKTSASTMSSDSFCSSSGVSSSSSQLNVSRSDNETMADNNVANHLNGFGRESPSDSLGQKSSQKKNFRLGSVGRLRTVDNELEQNHHQHISTITIGDCAPNVTYNEEEEDLMIIAEFGLARHPVKKNSLEDRPIPTIETEEPTPITTPIASLAPRLPAKEDLLRFILEGNLEAS